MSENIEGNVDVRQTMLAISANSILQYFLTILSGRALADQRPLFSSNAATQFVSSFAFLFGGAALSLIILQTSPWFWILLLVTWILTTAGARKMQTEICHQISHGVFTGNKFVDRILMEQVSTVLWIQDFEGYQKDHRSHHGMNLATSIDPDVIFQIMLGFKPGMTKEQLWRHLFKTIFSPGFHLRFLYSRFRANFESSPLYRRLMSVVWLTTLISFVAITGIWLEFFIAWFLPVTVFYQISALLQFLSEHRWLRTRRNDETKKEHLAKLTAARFFGEPYPAYSNVFAKLLWCARMIFWHAPCRLFVCPGTLPVHDAHHRHAGTTEWANLIFVRQRDVDAGCSKWETPYMEVWGMREALDKSFEHFASLPPIVVSQNAESKTAVLGM